LSHNAELFEYPQTNTHWRKGIFMQWMWQNWPNWHHPYVLC